MLNIDKFNKLNPNVKAMLIEVENNINNGIPFARIDISSKHDIPYNSLSNYYRKYIENKHLHKKREPSTKQFMVRSNDRNELVEFSVISERLNLSDTTVRIAYSVAMKKMHKYCGDNNLDLMYFLEDVTNA